MEGIGRDGKAVRVDPARKLQEREPEVEEKRDPSIPLPPHLPAGGVHANRYLMERSNTFATAGTPLLSKTQHASNGVTDQVLQTSSAAKGEGTEDVQVRRGREPVHERDVLRSLIRRSMHAATCRASIHRSGQHRHNSRRGSLPPPCVPGEWRRMRVTPFVVSGLVRDAARSEIRAGAERDQDRGRTRRQTFRDSLKKEIRRWLRRLHRDLFASLRSDFGSVTKVL